VIDPAAIAARVEQVWRRIESAGGTRERVRLVAVTKTFGADVVAAAKAAEVLDFGENYAQELEAKAAVVSGVRWHFLGAIQRRKVRDLAPLVSLWHGVDRVDEGEAIAAHAPGAEVLVQVNVSGEPSKAGCPWHDAAPLIAQLRALDLEVRGLMAVGPLAEPEAARPHFRRLAELGRSLGLPELSMGMSGDLEVAVEEGATIVRVGTSIFGSRSVRR
jgi:pyridoxal phosphate enzyme (YggS family)